MIKFIIKLCVFFALFCPIAMMAQDINAKYITESIQLDGILDEDFWEAAEPMAEFQQYFPSDSVVADYPTHIRMAYDDEMIYVGIKAEAPNNEFVVTTLKRDFRGSTNDNVTVLFDTFSDGTNAFGFGVTPYGVRREVLISGGGAQRSDFNSTWDAKWEAESHIGEDFYSAEMAIPLTSLKFENGAQKWRFRAYRFNLQTNEQSTSAKIPQNQFLSSLAFMGDLNFERPLGKSRTPLALIPYINGLTQKDFATDINETSVKVGGDAKIAIGDGMNLDLTLNPDFSNVEVDDVFTNLTRFELRLPEKRQFFIDNGDLFSSFGNRFNEARPFFSRRIGLARDTSGNLIQNDIIAGARLSGKLDENWRLGFLNIQTAKDAKNEIASNNNMMFALQRKVADRSNIGIFMINRETFGDEDFVSENETYNRVIGADYNLATSDNQWQGRFYLHKSLQPDDEEGNLSSQASLTYNDNTWIVTADFAYVDEDFQADLGFVPRNDIFKTGNSIQRFFFPKNSKSLTRHSARALFLNYWSPNNDFNFTDNFLDVRWQADFESRSQLSFGYRHDFVFLPSAFDPTRTEGAIPIPGNADYYFNQYRAEYESTNTKLLTYNLEASAGGFYNGNRYSTGGEVAYRFQPWAQFSVGANYDGIRLPDPYPDADILLLTQRSDITFNKSLFWSTLVQYSNQRDNLGINSRLQWRFAPLSDLFLVYNDNYFTEQFGPSFRSVNLKASYRFNK